jgi:hypothetical protein
LTQTRSLVGIGIVRTFVDGDRLPRPQDRPDTDRWLPLELFVLKRRIGLEEAIKFAESRCRPTLAQNDNYDPFSSFRGKLPIPTN